MKPLEISGSKEVARLLVGADNVSVHRAGTKLCRAKRTIAAFSDLL
jgi:hypothetical protein